MSRTAKALEAMFATHQPEAWYFGHYHINRTIVSGPTTFHCLNELSVSDPIEIGKPIGADAPAAPHQPEEGL
jgi:hypothetical protein